MASRGRNDGTEPSSSVTAFLRRLPKWLVSTVVVSLLILIGMLSFLPTKHVDTSCRPGGTCTSKISVFELLGWRR